VAAVSLVILALFAGIAIASGENGRDPLDAADIRIAGGADRHAQEYWGGSYGGYWVKPMALKGPFTFHFAFTRGRSGWQEKLDRLFPLNRGTYVIKRRTYTFGFLLDLQRQVNRDRERIRKGELKAPGKKPWQIGSYPSPERDCLVLEKGPMEKSFRKWARNRYGDKVCLDQMFSGPD
jgi:hypothetical protein